MKKILILEDNLDTLKYIEAIVKEIDPQNRVFSFTGVQDAYCCAMEKSIDLFIIDIILDTRQPGDSPGLRFVENLRKVGCYEFTPVLFVTSLEDAKLVTYERLHCYRFVEKPFDAEVLKDLVGQCLRFPGKTRENKTLYFQQDGIIFVIDSKDIVYVESCNHLLYIYTNKGDKLEVPYYTLKKFYEQIDHEDFLQCRRNTVVNRKYIDCIDSTNRFIRLKGKLGEVEIGMVYRKNIKDWLA